MTDREFPVEPEVFVSFQVVVGHVQSGIPTPNNQRNPSGTAHDVTAHTKQNGYTNGGAFQVGSSVYVWINERYNSKAWMACGHRSISIIENVLGGEKGGGRGWGG